MVVFAAVSLAWLACGQVKSPAQAALDRALDTWSNSDLAHYRMTTQRWCECLPEYVQPIVVEVLDGTIVSAVYEAAGEPVSAEVLETVRTVDGMFALIQDALDQEADVLEVSYDPMRGFPVEIFVDYDLGLADEEFSISVRDFTVLR